MATDTHADNDPDGIWTSRQTFEIQVTDANVDLMREILEDPTLVPGDTIIYSNQGEPLTTVRKVHA